MPEVVEAKVLVGKKKFLEKYGVWLKNAGIKIDATVWIAMGAAVSIAVAVVSAFVIMNFVPFVSVLFSFVLFCVVADLFIGYPYIKEMKRIDEIEEALPDALKQMADTLKVGGTYEFALREISTSEYGPLAKEMSNALRKLEEGENLENSLRTLAENIDSRLVKRSVAIIVDSIKAGAGLADILEEIADDIRELHRIGVERKARTMMEFLFIVSAGAIVAPAIFGMVSSIIGFLIETVASGGISSVEVIAEAIKVKDFIILLLQVYIFFEVIASSAMISIMREGKIGKSIIYIPALLFMAFIAYYVAAAMTGALVSGA